MTDLSRWPSRHGARWHQTSVRIPPEWYKQFYADLETIRRDGDAENDNHAIHLAVHEMAQRLREEDN